MIINPIITGSTGMVGEGVLHKCLEHPCVENVLVINRRPCGVVHNKLRELILRDFNDISAYLGAINELPLHDSMGKEISIADYNACFFCAGVTSIGKNEEEYSKLTYDLTLNFARTLFEINPNMTFCYISGTGTDSSEKGKSMWARVKGKTENGVLNLFKSAYMFRPGFIKPFKGLKHSYKISKAMSPIYPVMKLLFGKYVCTLEELSHAMINSALNGYEKNILENRDIQKLGRTNL